MARKVIFLDRDGTINVDHGFVHDVAEWEFVAQAPKALKILQETGYALAIITSQSGIGHNLYTESQMHMLHNYMKEQLAARGVHIDAVAFCPHARDAGCECRKPKIGMAKQIEDQLGEIDYSQSWTVGDKEADVGFGKNAGTRTALIRSGYWQERQLLEQPDLIVNSLYEFAQRIQNEE